MSLSTGEVVDDIKRLIVAGLTEAAGEAKAEFEAFAEKNAPIIAELAVRASLGDLAAEISIEMLRQQILTKAARQALRAKGVGEKQASLVMGMVMRVVIGAL